MVLEGDDAPKSGSTTFPRLYVRRLAGFGCYALRGVQPALSIRCSGLAHPFTLPANALTLQPEAASGLAIAVQGIEVGAVPGGTVPLIGALDRGALAPLVEGRHQLPRRSRGHHVPHVLLPAWEIPRQPHRPLDLPEARTDRVGIAGLMISRNFRGILVPALRLIGTIPIPRKDFEYHVGADRVGPGPAVGHRAVAIVSVVDEDDELAVDAGIVRVAAEMVADVGQVGPQLLDGRIGRALILVVEGPAKAGARRGGEQGRDPR